MAKLNYQTRYPDRFERQKVPQVVNVFNKTVAALNMHGYEEIAIFMRQITRMWNILNIKSPKKGMRLNDQGRCVAKCENEEKCSQLTLVKH